MVSGIVGIREDDSDADDDNVRGCEQQQLHLYGAYCAQDTIKGFLGISVFTLHNNPDIDIVVNPILQMRKLEALAQTSYTASHCPNENSFLSSA